MHGFLVRVAVGAVVAFASVVTLGGASVGCMTYESELGRAEEHFTHDEHEQALAGLRALESDWSALDTRDRARYCYLRGMTDYRIGFKADARHWLAIAAQIDLETPGSLVPSERSLVTEKLDELNTVIWSGDVLAIEEPPGEHHPKKVETTKSTDEDKDEEPEPKSKAKDKPTEDDDDSPMPKAKKKKSDE
ncbi:MAG: hypothetical protein ABI175_02025 [Polyangiales bacterium]